VLAGQTHAAEPGCAAADLGARAAAIADPRSIVLEDGRELRLAGIETFALLLPEGAETEAALQRRLETLLAGPPLRFRQVGQKPDRYGRLPAVIELDSGELVQEALAREGLAVAFASGPLPCFEKILAAENEARQKRRGFWVAAALPEARPDALRELVGRFAIFEGRVLSVGNRPGRTYLNFGSWWARDVTVEIAARDRELFGGEAALASLAGRRLRVRGFVQEKGGPMLVASSPMQIETLPEAVPAEGYAP
jgi:endonuclease YncB( thermonuclease family)